MTTEIDVKGGPDDSINRLTAAVERLEGSLSKLGNSGSSLDKLTKQMASMTKVMKSGFEELIELQASVEARSERMAEVAGARRLAQETAAEERRSSQLQSASERKLQKQVQFEQKQEGYGNKFRDRELDREIAFENKLARITEAGLQAQLAARADAYAARAALEQAQQVKLQAIQTEEGKRLYNLGEGSSALAWKNYLDLESKKAAADEAAAARQRALDEQSAARSWQAYLDLESKKLSAEEQRYAKQNILDEQSAARSWQAYLDLESKKLSAEEQRYAKQNGLDEQSAARSWQTFLELEAKKASATERNALLNMSYQSATPAGQLRIQSTAAAAVLEGLDPSKLVGTKAAADAAGKSLAELHSVIAAGRAPTAALKIESDLLNDSLRQAEGAFRGAAHQAGVYGLHHGQLIALLAGGAVAAALHHIAETGAEVEYELANLNALSGEMKPINIDKFINITSGTLTSIKDAAAGMAALAEAGMGQERAMAVLPDVMRLATLGNMSVAQSAEMAVESMHAFGKSDSDIGRIGDILVSVGSKANVSVHKLAEDMKSAATTGQLFNLSMEEITATVGALAERGLTIQPLSSALNKLYEPSAKTAAVMKDWGLTTKNDLGSLKEYTAFMGELKDKVAEFKVPADALKQLGMSPQSIKAMEVMTQHWGDYKHLLDDAKDSQGKMFDAMVVKENTAEGALKRLGSTVDDVFVKAFSEASPIVQRLEEQMIHLAGSQSTVDLFVRFAVGIAQFTQVVVDNASAIGKLIAAIVGLKIVAGVIASIQSLAIAYDAATAASIAKGVADRAEIVRLAALTVEQRAAALAAKELAAGSILAGEGMAVAATGVRAFSTALGVIGLVVTAATLAYEIFGNKLEEQDKLRIQANNTTETTIDAYNREIERLKGVEEQLLRTGHAGKEAADMVAMLHAQEAVTNAESAVKKASDASVGPNELGLPGRLGASARSGQVIHDKAVDAANKILNEATEALHKLDEAQQHAAVLSSNVAALMTISDLKKKLESMPSIVVPVVSTAAAKEAAEDANTRLENLRKEAITEANSIKVKSELSIVEKDILATKRDAVAINAKGARDELNAEIAKIALAKELLQVQQKTQMLDLELQNKSGMIGDAGLAAGKIQIARDMIEATVAQARADIDATAGTENKRAALQKYNNAIAKGKEEQRELSKRDELERAAQTASLGQANLQIEADNLKRSGDLRAAFNLKFEADNGLLIKKLQADLAGIDREGIAQALFVDPDNLNALAEYNRLLAITKTLSNKQKERNDGGVIADFDTVKAQLESLMNTARLRLSEAKEAGQEEGGLSGALGVAEAAKGIRDQIIPQINDLGDRLNKLAAGSGLPALVEGAKNANKTINDLSREASKASQPFGDAWKNVWKEIEAGARDAFLNIGEEGLSFASRMGKAIKKGILDMLYQMTVKKWMISIGASISGGASAASDAGNLAGFAGGAQGGVLGTIGTAASALSSAANLLGASSVASFGSGLAASVGASGSADAAMLAYASATGNLATGASLGAGLGGGITTALAAIPVWGWAALAVAAAAAYMLNSGPEDHTRLTFGSNNTPGNISINERGNEGKSDSYINNSVKSALGSFGVVSTFWMDAGQKPVQDFLHSVAATDDALSAFMTTTEKASVSTYLTGRQSTADLGAEGSDPTAGGQLDKVFAQRMHDIMEGLETGLSGLITGFVGTSQELATETSAILSFRSALRDSGQAVFGVKLTLQQVAALKLPTENTSAALTRVTGVFNATNIVATQVGKTMEATFGAIGLESLSARESLVLLTGGISALNTQTSFYATNFLDESDKIKPIADQLTKSMADLGLAAITTKAQFKDKVASLKLETEADRVTYAALMQLAPAFAQVADYTANLTGELDSLTGVAKTAAEIAGERRSLQTELNSLTKTQNQLDEIARANLSAANQDLYDQVQAAKKVKTAKDDLNASYVKEQSTIKDTMARIQSLSEGWKKFRDGLLLGNLSPLTPAQKYLESKSQFESTLLKAKGGDVKSQDGLEAAASAFLDASRVSNASGSAYNADFQRVTDVMSSMNGWAETEVNASKASLEAMKAQVGSLISIDAGVKSVAEAITALGVTLGADGPSAITKSQEAGLGSLYEQILNRAPDKSGLEYWMAQMTKGTSLNDISRFIAGSQEANPTIYHGMTSNRSANAANSDASLLEEVRKLNAEVAKLREEMMMHTGATLDAQYDSTNKAADKVVAGMKSKEKTETNVEIS